MSRLLEVAFHECQTMVQQTRQKKLREWPKKHSMDIFIKGFSAVLPEESHYMPAAQRYISEQKPVPPCEK